jgi:hypothetical protein
MIDPANDGLRAAVAGVVDRDPHAMTEGLLLVSTEELITARNLLDAAIASHVQALDARCVTLSHCAAHTKAWLVQDQHLSVADCPFHHHVVHHSDWNINRDHHRKITIWRT